MPSSRGAPDTHTHMPKLGTPRKAAMSLGNRPQSRSRLRGKLQFGHVASCFCGVVCIVAGSCYTRPVAMIAALFYVHVRSCLSFVKLDVVWRCWLVCCWFWSAVLLFSVRLRVVICSFVPVFHCVGSRWS